MESESDESFDGFSDVGSDIQVNVNTYSDVSSVSSVSSDDDLDEVETAWTDVLVGIDDRLFGAGVDAAVPGCSFVLAKEANEFYFFQEILPPRAHPSDRPRNERICEETVSQERDRCDDVRTTRVHWPAHRVFRGVFLLLQASVEDEMAILCPCHPGHNDT